MAGAGDIDVAEAEQEALHELQLGVKNRYRGYGSPFDFHHLIGRWIEHLHDAEELLREAGFHGSLDVIGDTHTGINASGVPR